MSSAIIDLIAKEEQRQQGVINLIASENYVSSAVLHATGSVLTNKYAEGYPGRRYYGGCSVIDEIELQAIAAGKGLFRAEHLNVQPHSGSTANMAAYLSVLKPGDTILAMQLAAGGHLTHGHKINFSGFLFNAISYGVSPQTEQLDYDEIALLADQHKPKLIVAGASAYARLIDFEKIAAIAQQHGALCMIDMAHIAGLVAAGIHPSPMPYADIVTTTTHKTLRGPRGGAIACRTELGAKIDKTVMPGIQGGPLMHVIAAKGIAFEEAATDVFRQYQRKVVEHAKILAHELAQRGYRIITGGTDNHLVLIDLRTRFNEGGLSGKEAEHILEQCNIIVNRNMIPFDPTPPTITSGLRIGTPAITTRGMQEKDIQTIAAWIDEALSKRHDQSFLKTLGAKIQQFARQFPLHPEHQ